MIHNRDGSLFRVLHFRPCDRANTFISRVDSLYKMFLYVTVKSENEYSVLSGQNWVFKLSLLTVTYYSEMYSYIIVNIFWWQYLTYLWTNLSYFCRIGNPDFLTFTCSTKFINLAWCSTIESTIFIGNLELFGLIQRTYNGDIVVVSSFILLTADLKSVMKVFCLVSVDWASHISLIDPALLVESTRINS